MALYMIQAAYTSDSWAAQIRSPRNRLEDLRGMVADHGVTIRDGWYSFGEYDIVLIAESQSNVDTVAVLLSAAAGGAIRSLKTTVLMTMEEGMEAMRKAADISYRPPASG